MTSETRLPFAICLLGGILFAVGLGWWWLVFRQVIDGDYLSYGQAAVCIAGSTDLCMLAQALCKTDHFLGLTSYSPEVFWAGTAVLATGLVLGTRTTAR